LDCRMILRKIRVFFARKPLLTRSKPFMRPIRRTRAVRDVATLSGFGIGQELYCKDDLAVLLLFKKNYPLLLRPAEHGDHATGGRAGGTQRGVGNGFRNSGLALKRNYRPSLQYHIILPLSHDIASFSIKNLGTYLVETNLSMQTM
jgi:hypothetical protein